MDEESNGKNVGESVIHSAKTAGAAVFARTAREEAYAKTAGAAVFARTAG
jgi:hypothetical protein